ncbi:NADH dehydrogenase subunit 4 (mitochondrion) [Agrilus planipennis]|uniref:NADH-ubiquinone oxidoreductase chain 4 n=1 Tax=Agrilus planipennis TaxID=224129 RepID=A0A1B0VF81_AGRPL|nr:NADH dehydrogenase subunit 4 [Agrilus planipennis]AMV73980.1 NADH dehydrogenase subunit 4 [Agrilus planipennis]
MMKFLLMMLMMIPLSLLKNFYWINQFMFFALSFFFILNMSVDWTFLNVYGMFGWDLLSYVLVLLSMWICSLMVLASVKIKKESFYCEFFCLVVLSLLIALFFAFSSLNFFVFYLFFEISLIPTLILILGWGYQPERIQAGAYLLFYTLFASLPMLIAIFYLVDIFDSLFLSFFDYPIDSLILFFCVNLVFLIKLPMYFIHLWLPKAHVEAPVSGSMILAGIMLKLGGYGMLRMMKLFVGVLSCMNYIFIGISVLGGVFISFLCLRQTDVKSLIAYSSVAHMGLVLGGIITFTYWGFCGALVMMVAHGLSSSALFCLANITYERVGSRSLFLNKGMINLMPSMALWWFLFSACNMAAPPSLNLLGEIMLINSLVNWSFLNMLGLAFMSFFSACYSLYLFSCSQHGKFSNNLYNFNSNSLREFLLLFLHWLPLNFLILKGELISLFI